MVEIKTKKIMVIIFFLKPQNFLLLRGKEKILSFKALVDVGGKISIIFFGMFY